jgi:hypothetical protein
VLLQEAGLVRGVELVREAETVLGLTQLEVQAATKSLVPAVAWYGSTCFVICRAGPVAVGVKMLMKEYRITLPMSVEEYQVAKLYSVAEVSKNETGGGEGVEVVRNEPFENVPLLHSQFTAGQYTYKIYRLESRVPGWIRAIAPAGSLEIHEEAWNAYPYCLTVVTNPSFMKDNFEVVLQSYHRSDRGEQENVYELDGETLEEREVVRIDIANDEVEPTDYMKETDPSLFTSTKTGRGPLKGSWVERADPVMTVYKLVTVRFDMWGLQGQVETFGHSTERRMFLDFHRAMFCWTDRWHGLTMADIRRLEEDTKEKLDEERGKGDVKGTADME